METKITLKLEEGSVKKGGLNPQPTTQKPVYSPPAQKPPVKQASPK
ncbi:MULTISPECIES: hypothetical protein [Carboxydocella]|nr:MULTISPECIES: hypothetical protein [Carboxydocella]